MELSEDQVIEFNENGFLVISDFLNVESIGSLRRRIGEIVANFDLSEKGEVFTTKEQSRAAGDYFLTSGGEIR